jgi:hypothetical protein
MERERSIWYVRRGEQEPPYKLVVVDGTVDYRDLPDPKVSTLSWGFAQAVLREAGYTWVPRPPDKERLSEKW